MVSFIKSASLANDGPLMVIPVGGKRIRPKAHITYHLSFWRNPSSFGSFIFHTIFFKIITKKWLYNEWLFYSSFTILILWICFSSLTFQKKTQEKCKLEPNWKGFSHKGNSNEKCTLTKIGHTPKVSQHDWRPQKKLMQRIM